MPAYERAGDPRPLRPATVTLSRMSSPAISAPAFLAALVPGNQAGRADTRGCTPDSAAHVKPGHAASAARPWPSVESRRLHRPRDRHGRRPLYVRGHRNIGVYSATR
jgi:hypothetical protein